jgi:hypothetical protein
MLRIFDFFIEGSVRSMLKFCFFLMIFICSACTDTSNPSVELSGLNYTDVFISTFTVDGVHGPGIYANGGGGKFVCCVTVPRRWHPGLKVTVRWTADQRVPNLWKERVVGVPKYTNKDFGGFVVHFYPDDTVKVLVTSIFVGHRNYPYPRPN